MWSKTAIATLLRHRLLSNNRFIVCGAPLVELHGNVKVLQTSTVLLDPILAVSKVKSSLLIKGSKDKLCNLSPFSLWKWFSLDSAGYVMSAYLCFMSASGVK